MADNLSVEQTFTSNYPNAHYVEQSISQNDIQINVYDRDHARKKTIDISLISGDVGVTLHEEERPVGGPDDLEGNQKESWIQRSNKI